MYSKVFLLVQEVFERNVACKRTNVDRKIQRNILATVVERLYWPSNLVETRLKILLLPFPKYAVQVAMM